MSRQSGRFQIRLPMCRCTNLNVSWGEHRSRHCAGQIIKLRVRYGLTPIRYVFLDTVERVSNASRMANVGPVFSQKTTGGFKQEVYVMFHGTKPKNVAPILRNGFIPSNPHRMLGSGIYVSKDVGKVASYGSVTLKLLVYTGNVRRITFQKDPNRTSWRDEHSSGWVPPDCGMVGSGREENAIKSKRQIRVLGVCRGWEELDNDTRQLTMLVSRKATLDSRPEKDALKEFLQEEGIRYCHLTNVRSGMHLSSIQVPSGEQLPHLSEMDRGNPFQLWTRSWDGCVENKGDGLVLDEIDVSGRLVLTRRVAGKRSQKWKIDKAGRLINKGSQKSAVAVLGGPDVETRTYNKSGDWRFWRFVDYH